MVLRPFCACSTVYCVCLPRHFCCSRLVLFRSAACFVLFLHMFPATFVIFLWFGFSFLHVIPAVDTFCRSLFLSLCFFISVFTPILLHKRIWAFVGHIMLTGSKGSWAQFVFVCRSHSARELYYAADLYSAVDLHFAIDLYTKGFEKGLGPNLSSSAEAILPGNCILRQICILLQICVLL